MFSQRQREFVLQSPLRIGFVDLLTASFAIQFLGFGTLLLVPRFLLPEQVGELKVIQSFVSLFAIFAGFGFNTSVLKLCSEGRTADQRLSLLHEALRKTIVGSIGALALVFLLARSGLLGASDHLQSWLIIYSLILPFETLTNVFASYLQAEQRMRDLARTQLFVKVQAVVLIVLATWQFGFDGFVYATIAGYAIGLIPFVKRIGVEVFNATRIRLPRLFWSLAGFSSLANGINTLGRHADLYILGLFYHDPRDLGFYALAKIFVSGANVVTGTAQRIALPQLSAKSRSERAFRTLTRRSQLQTFLLSLVVAAALHVGASLIVRFLYKSDYGAAIQYLDILLIKFVIWSGFAIFGVALIGIGKPAYNFLGACITTPIALGLSYYFLSKHGTVGMAWAQVATAALTLPILLLLYRLAARKHFGSENAAADDRENSLTSVSDNDTVAEIS